MARARIELQQILETLLGSRNVYFQPPASLRMVYPAIVYEWDNESVQYADNVRHRAHRRYSVTSIDRDPDSATPDRIALLPYSSFDRSFKADDLNHVVYNLYF